MQVDLGNNPLTPHSSPTHPTNKHTTNNQQDFDADLGGYQSDSQVDLPLEGDDYDDELEALLYADDYGSNGSGSRGRRGRRRHRG